MTSPDEADGARAVVLTHWRWFCAKALPGTVRRIAAWKGVPRGAFRDLLDDVAQDLVADGLEHAEELAAMPRDACHARWMRHVERLLYRERIAPRRRCGKDASQCAGPGLAADWATAAAAPPALALLANGRCNLARSAAAASKERSELSTAVPPVSSAVRVVQAPSPCIRGHRGRRRVTPVPRRAQGPIAAGSSRRGMPWRGTPSPPRTPKKRSS